MSIPNEDSLRDHYDHVLTHNDPASPYYDGEENTRCPHGVEADEYCEICDAPEKE